ncbi:hypothetical protein [Acidipropionibacterium timonense]|uniref:hypothetical protein n=1 Tax=Acidipropionibacterium timonense TaxID=2161818 RepID=UPI0010303F6F|nr:hypothetical protein [Acidipropionibacterium timonense]
MASTHKTFTRGEVLTSDDVNNALNPTTADHIPYAIATGTVTVTISASGTSGTGSITFPSGRFTSAPTVIIQPADTGSGANAWQWFSQAITASGATAVVNLTPGTSGLSSSTSHSAFWVAIQMSA